MDISAEEVPGLIDELPGDCRARRAWRRSECHAARGELRVKESDRIAALVAGFRALGIDADERDDGFVVRGPEGGASLPRGGAPDARGDHRMAMAFAIAALGADRPSTIAGADAVAISYPGFLRDARTPRRVKADKIYLVGFMAAGKTTRGARARQTPRMARGRRRRSDRGARADEGVGDLRQTRRTVFPGGRARRAAATSSRPRHLVVATGGGTFVDAQNRAAINRDGVSVWLDAPLDRIVDRLPSDGRRPLAADRAELERLYHARRAAYALAHVRVDAGRASVDALVEQLVDWLEA